MLIKTIKDDNGELWIRQTYLGKPLNLKSAKMST